jgi:hypothetical protein
LLIYVERNVIKVKAVITRIGLSSRTTIITLIKSRDHLLGKKKKLVFLTEKKSTGKEAHPLI